MIDQQFETLTNVFLSLSLSHTHTHTFPYSFVIPLSMIIEVWGISFVCGHFNAGEWFDDHILGWERRDRDREREGEKEREREELIFIVECQFGCEIEQMKIIFIAFFLSARFVIGTFWLSNKLLIGHIQLL